MTTASPKVSPNSLALNQTYTTPPNLILSRNPSTSPLLQAYLISKLTRHSLNTGSYNYWLTAKFSPEAGNSKYILIYSI